MKKNCFPILLSALVALFAIMPVSVKANPTPDNILSSLLSGLISSDKVTAEDMVGTWAYSAPAVSFKSENLLKKAGGVAVTAAAKTKLEPYYKKVGLDKLTFTVDADSAFVIKVKSISLKGTIKSAPEDSEANAVLSFNLGALSSVSSLADVDAYITMSGSKEMSLMFDVTKLKTIIRLVGSLSSSSAINAVSTILDQYDGITAGFELKKQE